MEVAEVEEPAVAGPSRGQRQPAQIRPDLLRDSMTDSDDDDDKEESGARADGGGDDYDEGEEEEEDLYTYARREMERIQAARKARKAAPPASVRGEKPSAPRYGLQIKSPKK